MTKTSVFASVLAVGATVGLLAYAVSRRTNQVAKALPVDEAAHPAGASTPNLTAPGHGVVADLVPIPLVTRKVGAVQRSSDEEPTVQCLVKAPALVGSDDSEALDPDDLGGDWLARAAQSERSLSESDLDIALEDLPDSTSLGGRT